MSEDDVIRTALERGWTSADHVETARRLEADLRARGRSPGLLLVLAQGMAPEHVDSLRREHALAASRSADSARPIDMAASGRLPTATHADPSEPGRAGPSSGPAVVALDAMAWASASAPVFESGRLPRSDQPTARYEETLPLPEGPLGASPIPAARSEVGTARFDETLPLPEPSTPRADDPSATRPDPDATPVGGDPLRADPPIDPRTGRVLDPFARPQGVAAGPVAASLPASSLAGQTAGDGQAAGPRTPATSASSEDQETRDDPAIQAADGPVVRGWGPGLRLTDDLVLGAKVGEGAMGAVFEAERAGQRVAVKVLPAGAHGVAVERFKREGSAQALSDAHPVVARVLGSGEANGRMYLVLEHLPGGDLQRRLDERGPMPWRDAVVLVGALARGIEHVHQRGILHRDLKPSNVMFDGQGAPRLVDFGVARVAGGEQLTMTGAVVGTPSFAPPEQVAGESERVERRSDVYGLGAILFAALTGRPPFDGPSVPNVITQVLRDPPPVPSALVPGIPPALDRVVLAALAKEPAQRPASAGALADDLERLLRGEAVAAEAPRRPLPPWLMPLALGLGGSAVILIVGAIAGRARLAAMVPPSAMLDAAALTSSDAVVVTVTVGGTEARPRLVVDGKPCGLDLPAAGAARIHVPLPAPGEHALRLVVEGPGGAEAVASALVTRLLAPQASLDPAPRTGTGGAARLTGRLEGTLTRAWVEVDGERRALAPAQLRSAAGERLDVTFPVPSIARCRVRLIVQDERLGAEHVTGPVVWSDLPVAPEGMTVGPDGVYTNARDGSRLRWIWPGSGHLGLDAQPDDFQSMAEGFPNLWRAVSIEEGYFLGEREVTLAQVAAFCRARRMPLPRQAPCVTADGPTGATGEHPATALPWALARDYCAWAGLRLPSEVEWEWAVRGPDELRYPWGREPRIDEPLANTAEHRPGRNGERGLLPGGTFAPGVFSGCFDLAGNAWEFVADHPVGNGLHVIRGGSFDHDRVHAHAGFRYPDRATAGSVNTGFRVARGWRQVGPSPSLPPDPR